MTWIDPKWLVGDSREADKLLPEGEQYDFILTCPPYFDLEVYSDDPRDLSKCESYEEFLRLFKECLGNAVARLREDRFVVVVVGEIRGGDGMYRNFVGDTITLARDVGLKYYNHAALVTPVGSLPLRVGRQFDAGRKLGKHHQDMLVFVKGDPFRATSAVGPVELPVMHIEEPDAEPVGSHD